MISDSFDDRAGARVAHAEALGGNAPEEALATRGAIQRDIADQHLLFGLESARLGRIDDEPAPAKALADIVVGVALHLQCHSARQPGAEALARAAVELEVNRPVGKHSRPNALDDLVGQHAAHDAVDVDDRQFGADFLATGQGGFRQADEFIVERRFETVVLLVDRVHAQAVLRLLGRRQDFGQIQASRLPMAHRPVHIQRIHAPDHVVDRPESQVRHDRSQFFGDHEQVVHHVLRRAGELGPEHRVLGRDPHGTGVEMALAHHDAAERDKRRRREAELLRSEERGNGDVPARLELPVGLQHDAGPEVVHHEGLMRFRNAEFPRHAGVLDGGERRCAGAAGVAGDHEVIGSRLGNSCRHGPDTDLGAELHADARFGVRVLQVVYELRYVLDGVDIVVRRRTYQAHARRRMADSRDEIVHLSPRQLPAFTGFRALDDLDLQLVGVGQVLDGHAETAASHLLDSGPLRVAVRQRRIARRVLSALAGIGLATDAVHGNGQRFVRLLRDRSETHGAGGEPLDDPLGRFHLVDIEGSTARAGSESQQPAQCAATRVLVVHMLGEALVGLATVAACGLLQVGYGVRVPHVRVPAAAPVEVAGVGQDRQGDGVSRRESDGVAALHLFCQDFETDPAHAARRAHEAALHHVFVEAHRLEDLRALVGLERRDAHLGHHFHHALGHPLAIRGDDVRIVRNMRRSAEIALAPGVPQGLEREIGIDPVGAVADEQAMVVHLAGFPRLHQDADARARVFAHEVMVHGAHGGQGTDRYAPGTDRAIRKDDETVAVDDGLARFRRDAVEGL